MSKADDELRRAGCFELFEVDAVSDQPASATPKGNGRATSAGAAPEKLAKGSPSSASHPNARNGMPTTIEVRMNVFNVSNVDEKNFVFEAKFYLELAWEDHRLYDVARALVDDDGNASDVETAKLPLPVVGKYPSIEEIALALDLPQITWDPQVGTSNQVMWEPEQDWFEVPESYWKDGRPMITHRRIGTGRFYDFFDLHDFPFDAQSMRIKFRSDRLMDEVELVPSTRYPSVLQTNQFIAENFFRFVGEPKWEARVGKGVAGERSELQLDIACVRRQSFFYFHAFIPMFMITTLTFSGFVGAPADLGGRQAVATTMVLAGIAYSYSINEKLPDLQYMTLCDSYMFACLVMQFLVVVCSFLTGLLDCSSFHAKRLDIRWEQCERFREYCAEDGQDDMWACDKSDWVRQLDVTLYATLSLVWFAGNAAYFMCYQYHVNRSFNELYHSPLYLQPKSSRRLRLRSSFKRDSAGRVLTPP